MRRRRKVAERQPIVGMGAKDAAAMAARARQQIGPLDDLPDDVRAAIRECDFAIRIQRMPRGFNVRKAGLVEKIRGLKTFRAAEEFDKWLAMAGLR